MQEHQNGGSEKRKW